jgi:co-chaperonin GroES (HSP10)
MSQLQATGTRMIIEKIEHENKTAGGILLQTQQEAPRARVVSIGDEVKGKFAPGDELIVDWSKVGHFTYNTIPSFVIDESTVIAVVKKT